MPPLRPRFKYRRWFRYAFVFCVLIAAGWLVIVMLRQPSNNRNWTIVDQVLPYAVFAGDTVNVYNIRDFKYQGDDQNITQHYYDRTFNLNDLNTVWFGVDPFDKWRGIAHTFVSFGFADGHYVTVSVETRMEQGETYSPVAGLFNTYELIYEVGDENDIIKVRTNYRHETIDLYPIKTTQQRMRAMFVDMLLRANQLRDKPEFYHTITNNCTSNIVNHVDTLVPGRVPRWSWRVLLPGYSDYLAYKLGLIDTTLPWDQLRDYYKINSRAEAISDDVDSETFSKIIREFDTKQ